ncbi:MAG TPA: alpha-glucan family phosphorylase, partial [Bacteroidales bacterium]|nr:alpha-glucan family phosphorylase [Bacteroidales bacterium]
TTACKKDRWLGMTGTLDKDFRRVSDLILWQMRTTSRKLLIEYARERLSLQLEAAGIDGDAAEKAKHIFDPDILTLGFARRFAPYKRPNLLLHDRARLTRLLINSQYPIQLLIAGKAHPGDQEGQEMIREWIQFIRQSEIRPHVIFLSDYDMLMTEHLVQGVDVWLNTPRRPWEACGTSGMKVLVNGGLNLSELDGWWAEAFTPEVGWALGDGNEHENDPEWDAVEAETLYNILEHQVIPEFYNRDRQGMPVDWIAKIRESMAHLTPLFSASRTVREYTEQHYLPAAIAYEARSANHGTLAKQISDWQHLLKVKWSRIQFGELTFSTVGDQHLFEVSVNLNGLDPDAVKMELFANGITNRIPERVVMSLSESQKDSPGINLYTATLPASRPATDYTARVIPFFTRVVVPLEANQILWQR